MRVIGSGWVKGALVDAVCHETASADNNSQTNRVLPICASHERYQIIVIPPSSLTTGSDAHFAIGVTLEHILGKK